MKEYLEKKTILAGGNKPHDHHLRSLFQTVASLLVILHVKYNRTAERLLLHIATKLSVTFAISNGPTGLFYHCCFKAIFVFICNLTKLIVWGCAVNLKVLWGNSRVQLSFPAVGSAGYENPWQDCSTWLSTPGPAPGLREITGKIQLAKLTKTGGLPQKSRVRLSTGLVELSNSSPPPLQSALQEPCT